MIGRTFILCAFALVLFARPGPCDEFYVDAQSGSDQTGDGSSEKPWRTITHSLAQIGPGDLATEHTLFVRPGTYDSSLGEVFPLRPGIQVSLVATGKREETVIRGDSTSDIFFFDKRISDGGLQQLSGLHLVGGRNGVVWSLVYTGGSAPLTLTNSTITKCSNAGVYLPPETGYSPLLVESCKISENGTGVLAKATLFAHFVDILNSEITDNASDGIYFLGDGYFWPSFDIVSNVIARNSGAGILMKVDHLAKMGGTLTNNTISHNAQGGFKGLTYSQCYYVPYYGFRCYYGVIGPFSSHNNTIYGNGAPGGFIGNHSTYVTTQSTSSIVWGNTPVDVSPGFQWLSYSNVGTGGGTGPGTIHLPPDFVDGPGGDLRLKRGSPCVDTGRPFPPPIPPSDIEGDARVLDGGSALRLDMGSDEFATFVAPVAPPVKGSPFQLFTHAPPAEESLTVIVLLSGGDGSQGGIPLPGSGGRTIGLEADTIFQLGLNLLPVLQATISGGQGTTTPFTIPADLPFTGEVFYAGVSIDLAGGQIVSITPTHSFVVQ